MDTYVPPHKRGNRLSADRYIDVPSDFNMKEIEFPSSNVDNNVTIIDPVPPKALLVSDPQEIINKICNKEETPLTCDERLILSVSKAQKEFHEKQAQQEYQDWVSHYDDYLQEMYELLIREEFPWITRNKFNDIAYKCTDTIVNRRDLKHVHPLI